MSPGRSRSSMARHNASQSTKHKYPGAPGAERIRRKAASNKTEEQKGGVSETATRVRRAAFGQDTGALELNLTRERINAGAKGEGKARQSWLRLAVSAVTHKDKPLSLLRCTRWSRKERWSWKLRTRDRAVLNLGLRTQLDTGQPTSGRSGQTSSMSN